MTTTSGARRYEMTLTAVLGLTFGVVFFDRNALNFLMPFILKDLPLSNVQIGMVASGLALSWALSGFLAGYAADRLGKRKPLLLAAVIIFSLASFITGQATSFFMLLGARLLMGLAEGPVLPISQSLMAQACAPERRGLNMGFMQNVLSNLMGSLVTPLVTVALAIAYGWRSTFFFTALPGLVTACLIWKWVKEPAAAVPTATVQSKDSGLRAVLASRNVRLCVPISALMVGWMITGWVFLPLYLTTALGLNPTQMSLMMSVLGVTGALAGFAVPGLSDLWGRKLVMIVGCFLGLLTPVAALLGGGTSAALTLFIGTGWMAGGTFSLFMATIPAESVAAGRVTTAMALIMGSGELLGGAAAPTVVGWLADHYGLTAPLIAQGVFAVGAGSLSLALLETAPLKRSLAPQQPVL